MSRSRPYLGHWRNRHATCTRDRRKNGRFGQISAQRASAPSVHAAVVLPPRCPSQNAVSSRTTKAPWLRGFKSGRRDLNSGPLVCSKGWRRLEGVGGTWLSSTVSADSPACSPSRLLSVTFGHRLATLVFALIGNSP